MPKSNDEAFLEGARNGTKEGMPFQHWKLAVVTLAMRKLQKSRKGIPARYTDLAKYERLRGAYEAGEAVWMAVSELVLVAEQRYANERAEGDTRTLRRAVSRGLVGWRAW